MDEKLKQIIKYRAWQISDAYERINSQEKYGLSDENTEMYYDSIMEFIFCAYVDLMRLESKEESL